MFDEEQLNHLLEQAGRGNSAAAGDFFSILLDSKVFVPVRTNKPVEQTEPTFIGDGQSKVPGFVTVQIKEREVLPIFSSSAALVDWAEQEIPAVEEEFKKLLWLVGDNLWLHLNPAQSLGKEISPWEIEKLRSGKEAIPEIISELGLDETEYVEVTQADDLFPDLKRQLRSMLEVFPEVEEAFLISFQETDALSPSAALGVKQRGLTADQLRSIHSELKTCFGGRLSDYANVALIDDLANEDSHNWSLFVETRPFYIAQLKTSAPENGWLERFQNLFRKPRSA